MDFLNQPGKTITATVLKTDVVKVESHHRTSRQPPAALNIGNVSFNGRGFKFRRLVYSQSKSITYRSGSRRKLTIQSPNYDRSIRHHKSTRRIVLAGIGLIIEDVEPGNLIGFCVTAPNDNRSRQTLNIDLSRNIQALPVIDWFEGYTEVVPGIPCRTYGQLLTYQRSARMNRAAVGIGFSSILAVSVKGNLRRL